MFVSLEMWLIYLYIDHLFTHAWNIGLVVLSTYGFFLFLYFLSFIDPAQRYGNRNWKWMRSRRIWKQLFKWWFPIEYHFQYHQFDKKKKYLFIVHPNPFNLGMLFGMGLHGGSMNGINLLWMCPKLFFNIPILRDFLLWAGAVEHGERNVIDLMNHGHNVCICPNEITIHNISKKSIKVKKAGPEIFEFALHNGIHLVPVLIYGESKLYDVWSNSKLRRFQRFTLRLLGYPIPIVNLGQWFSFLPKKKKEMHIYIGTPIATTEVKDPKELKECFYKELNTLNVEDFDQSIIYT